MKTRITCLLIGLLAVSPLLWTGCDKDKDPPPPSESTPPANP
jgi:hypothetical protein